MNILYTTRTRAEDLAAEFHRASMTIRVGRIVVETRSAGRVNRRPGFKKMVAELREGDVVWISNWRELGRYTYSRASVEHLITSRGAYLIVEDVDEDLLTIMQTKTPEFRSTRQ